MVLVALADGRWIGLTPQQLASALEAGATVMPPASPAEPSNTAADGPLLLSAEGMEKVTDVPASWWLKQARERRVPHRQVGKYIRFSPHAVLDSISVVEPVKERR